jgi:RNA polymerase sigma-70 factor (ECF subfamily)
MRKEFWRHTKFFAQVETPLVSRAFGLPFGDSPIRSATFRRKESEQCLATVMDDSDALLVRSADGDHDAFESFYEQASPAVYGVVVAVLRDAVEAQDVTQEVFLEAWRTVGRFDPERGSAKAWLLTMARRRAVDQVRSRQASADREAAVGARTAVPDYDSVTDTVEVRLEQQQVRVCLDELTSVQRRAVTLAFYRGYTHRELSTLLSVPLGTVKARLRDGLIRLRDCLGVL